MNPDPFRLPPAGPPQIYETFSVKAPIATHWRPASCLEVECSAHVNGWRTTVLAGSNDEALLRQACSGTVDGHRRHFVELAQADGLVQFAFEPGQPCLAVSTHVVPLERPELYVRRAGDWRAHLGEARHYARADQWVDDFMVHQDRIIRQQER